MSNLSQRQTEALTAIEQLIEQLRLLNDQHFDKASDNKNQTNEHSQINNRLTITDKSAVIPPSSP